MIQIKSFTFNILGTNCYVLWEDGGKRCVIVDPGMYRDFEEQEMLGFWTRTPSPRTASC